MTLVVDKFRTLLPSRAKSGPSGWTSFNAPCCHHRGHSQDKRKRGGLRFDNGIVYNCFNCKFTASWLPGRPLTDKFKSLCKWMGATDDDINTMMFEALKTESPEYEPEEYQPQIEFEHKPLPEGAMAVSAWLGSEFFDDVKEQLTPVVEYIISRGFDPMNNHFYWTPASGYENRVIIPFWYKGKIVGNTARRVTEGRPKYLSDQHPHFVFNIDRQSEEHKYVFACEGPFDAISINGVALLTNSIGDQQARILNNLGSEIIIIPDQDRAGLELVDKAIHYNFSVAFPNWEDDVKDVADAVQRYGKLFVVVDAIKTAQKGEIKLNMAKKSMSQKIKRIEERENSD
jgi:hypothetical protein